MSLSQALHRRAFPVSWAILGIAAGLVFLAPSTARADGIHTCGNDAPIGRFCYYETKPETYIPGILGSHGVSQSGQCRRDPRGNDKYCSNTLTRGPRTVGICPVPLSRSNRYCEVNR